jgi:hypothetical protein
MNPVGPRLEPPRPWWVKWAALAIFIATLRAVVYPTLKWLFGW